MGNDRVHAGKLLNRQRQTHGTQQLPTEFAFDPPHNSPHHRNLQPLKSAIHHNPAYPLRVPMRKMEHIHYPTSAPVAHSQIPAIVRPTVVQPKNRRPITVQKPRVAKPNKPSRPCKAATPIHPSVIKNDTSRPHTPVIPGRYVQAPQPPANTNTKGEATILHLDPPATRFPLPTPVVPAVVHTPTRAPAASAPTNVQRKRWRHTYLEAYRASLDAEAENHFVREQVAPLNPVLSAPPIPFHYIGTLGGRCLQTALFQGALEAMNPLPQIAWDVRCAPSTLLITARPYPFSDLTLTKKQMKRRALLDHNEVLRLYGQAATNPPCTVMHVVLQIGWTIKIQATSQWVSVRDVVEQIYSALLQPITVHEHAAHIQAKGHSRMPNPSRPSGHKRAAVLGSKTAWLGLVRDRGEMDDGVPVREMPTGEIDGGMWWLKLKKR